ncbi:MAG: hypothetical protein ACMG50_01980 [Thermomonas sp.]
MRTAPDLSPKDYENLALVAQGQATLLAPADAERLIIAGLVLQMPATAVSAASLQLTSTGLAHIRSSDQ